MIRLQQLQSVTPCKGIQISLRFRIPRRGFRIPTISEIPDSLSCILDSKVQDSGCHDSNLSAADSTAKISQIPESGFPYMWPSQSFMLNIKRFTMKNCAHNYQLCNIQTASGDVVASHQVSATWAPDNECSKRRSL